MDYPADHQELFDAFINDEYSLIDEFSESAGSDLTMLHQWAVTYAAQHGLAYKADHA